MPSRKKNSTKAISSSAACFALFTFFFTTITPLIFALVKGLYGYFLFYVSAIALRWLLPLGCEGCRLRGSSEDIALVGGAIYAMFGLMAGVRYIILNASKT